MSVTAEVIDATCHGYADGSISLFPSGGNSASYSFTVCYQNNNNLYLFLLIINIIIIIIQINGTASGSQKSDLIAGSYSVVAYDANNCPSLSQIVQVRQLDRNNTMIIFIVTIINIIITVVVITSTEENPKCAGSNTGSLTLSATGGGETNFQFSLNGDPVGDNIIRDLPAGEYSIVAQGANMCSSLPTTRTLVDPDGNNN